MPKAMETASKLQIHTGVHITRRKQMNIVTNEDGEPLWTGASIYEACRYCMDNGDYDVTLHFVDVHIRLMLGEPRD